MNSYNNGSPADGSRARADAASRPGSPAGGAKPVCVPGHLPAEAGHIPVAETDRSQAHPATGVDRIPATPATPAGWPAHGGQPQTILSRFGLDAREQLLDFSANLNPLGPPDWLEEAWRDAYRQLLRYPDPGYREARRAIAEMEGVDEEQVVLTNGGAEAIFLTASILRHGPVLIIPPTFGEYEQACRHYQIPVRRIPLEEERDFGLPLQAVLEEVSSRRASSVFLCRPNNPTGTAVPEPDIRRLLDQSLEAGAIVVADEAFADFMPEPLSPLTPLLGDYPNLILLRSLTKMYTIPGLRIGYILASASRAAALRAAQIPWSVNAAAAAIVPRIAGETQWPIAARSWLNTQLAMLRDRLRVLEYYMSPTSANFYLLRDNRDPGGAMELMAFLLERGIVPRHTQTFPGLEGRYLRLAVRSKEENEILLERLAQWRERRP